MSHGQDNRFRANRRTIRWCVLAVLAFLLSALIGTVVQLGPNPAEWSRRGGQVKGYGEPAYIHEDGAGYVLSDEAGSAVGMLSCYRIRRSVDDHLLLTRIRERLKLNVVIRDCRPDEIDVKALRDLAADHYRAPEIRDGSLHSRVIVFGYPGEWMALIFRPLGWLIVVVLQLLPFVLVLALPVVVANVIAVAMDPTRRRARNLHQGRCPQCRYIIRHLPENRCPECGETWRNDEMTPPVQNQPEKSGPRRA